MLAGMSKEDQLRIEELKSSYGNAVHPKNCDAYQSVIQGTDNQGKEEPLILGSYLKARNKARDASFYRKRVFRSHFDSVYLYKKLAIRSQESARSWISKLASRDEHERQQAPFKEARVSISTILKSMTTWERICAELEINEAIKKRVGIIYLRLSRKLARKELSNPYIILIAFALWLKIEKIIRQQKRRECKMHIEKDVNKNTESRNSEGEKVLHLDLKSPLSQSNHFPDSDPLEDYHECSEHNRMWAILLPHKDE